MEPIFVRKLNRKERDFLYDLIEDKKIIEEIINIAKILPHKLGLPFST